MPATVGGDPKPPIILANWLQSQGSPHPPRFDPTLEGLTELTGSSILRTAAWCLRIKDTTQEAADERDTWDKLRGQVGGGGRGEDTKLPHPLLMEMGVLSTPQ